MKRAAPPSEKDLWIYVHIYEHSEKKSVVTVVAHQRADQSTNDIFFLKSRCAPMPNNKVRLGKSKQTFLKILTDYDADSTGNPF